MPNKYDKEKKFREDILSALKSNPTIVQRIPNINSCTDSLGNEWKQDGKQLRQFNEQEFLSMIESLSDEQKAQYQDVVLALQNGTHHLEYAVMSFDKDDDTHSDFEVFLVDNEDRTNSKQITLPFRSRLMTADESMRMQSITVEFIKNNPKLLEKGNIAIEDIDEIIASLPEDKQKEYEPYKHIIKSQIESLNSHESRRNMVHRNNGFTLYGGSYMSYMESRKELSPLAIREQTLLELEKEEQDISEDLKKEQTQKEGQDIGE